MWLQACCRSQWEGVKLGLHANTKTGRIGSKPLCQLVKVKKKQAENDEKLCISKSVLTLKSF